MIQTNKDVSPEQVERDLFYLKNVCLWAKIYSDDKNTKNGSGLVFNNKIKKLGDNIIFGENKLPTGVEKTEERLSRPAKYNFLLHAEPVPIAKAAKFGIPTQGATMYSFYFPCGPCAGIIIESGLEGVVSHKMPFVWSNEGKLKKGQMDWGKSTGAGYEMFENHPDAFYRIIDGKLDVEVLFKDKWRKV